MDSLNFINPLLKEKVKTRAGVPAERREQVECIKEIVKEVMPKFIEEEIYEMLKQCTDPNLAAETLLANSLEEFEELKSKRTKKKANAPPFIPSASIHQSSQTLLQGNNFPPGHGFTHPCIEPSYYRPQLPLQHGCMSHDEYMHQNFGYDMASPQQEVYQGGSLSQANADPSSWGSFPGRGSTPHQFLPNSPAPSDSCRTQLNSALHVQAQRHHRNDYHPIGMCYNFAAWNNQPDPGVVSALPEQQQGGFPRWVPLPSDGNNQHHDMPSAQQDVDQGGGLSQANANTSGWGSFEGTGSTSSQSLPIPPHSPAPFNMSWTSHDSTLQAQDQCRNDHHFFIVPGLALTPHGRFLGYMRLPANLRNRRAGEGSNMFIVAGTILERGSGQTISSKTRII